MSNVERNVEIIRGIYAAFGRGDVPAILARMSDDVEWEMDGVDHGVPWLVPGRGKAHVGAFFQTLQGMEFRVFEVRAVMGQDDLVVGLVRLEAVVKATGKTIREPFEAHVWRLDAEGRITGLKHCADTHQHLQAARG